MKIKWREKSSRKLTGKHQQHAHETDEEQSIFITQQCNGVDETEEVQSIFITPLPSTSGASVPHSSFNDCAVSADYFELVLLTRRSERGNPAVNEQSKNPRTF